MMHKLKQGNHKLGDAELCRNAIAEAKEGDPLMLRRDGNLLRFHNAKDQMLGTLTSRHAVARDLETGSSLVYCAVAWTYEPSDRHPHGLVSARIHTGDPEDSYVKWCLEHSWGKPREAPPPKAYPVNIVGESFHQAAIRRCAEGDTVTLYREAGNPHDDRAIVVKTADGASIGYLPREHWLQRVVHEEGGGATVTILALHTVAGNVSVVLSAVVDCTDTGVVAYQARR